MATYISLVRGDSKPDIVVNLNDRTTWDYLDVSDASTSVTMKFRKRGTSDVLQTLTADKLTGGLQADGTIDTTVATPGAGGRVQFSWPVGSLDIDPGYYEGEVSINFPGGIVQTLHDVLKFSVRADF